jgi:hypothetical protein
MVTGPVLEGGIPPEEAPVLIICDISAFCAVARMASGRKRRFAVPIMTRRIFGHTESSEQSTDHYKYVRSSQEDGRTLLSKKSRFKA